MKFKEGDFVLIDEVVFKCVYINLSFAAYLFESMQNTTTFTKGHIFFYTNEDAAAFEKATTLDLINAGLLPRSIDFITRQE